MVVYGVGATMRLERARGAFGRALRERAADQFDELVRQYERGVVVFCDITKLERPIAHFGEHSAFIRGEYLPIVIIDQSAQTNTRGAAEINISDRHVSQET